MGVTSIRFNSKEEKLLQYLKDYYDLDTSTLLKKSLIEMYEDLRDRGTIEKFEKKAKKGKTEFISFEDITAG